MRVLTQSLAARIGASPGARAFLWGLASALALPPLHLLPVLWLSIPGFLNIIGAAKHLRQLAWLAWLFGFGLNLAGLYWITEPILTEADTFWWLVPFADPLLSFAVAFYIIIPAAAAFYTRPGLARVLVFAGAWVISDLLRQFAFSGFPWNLWGTDWVVPGQLGDVFIQLASLVGVHGLTLATILLACMPILRMRGLVIALLGLLAWGGFGIWHLGMKVAPTGDMIALVQPDFPVPGSYDRPTLLAHWQRLEAMSKAGIAAGANAVIWPEAASPWLLASDAGARAQLAEATGTTPIIAGSIRVQSDTDYHNSLVITAGPGPAIGDYDKWKLVPFGEYTPTWIPVRITPGIGFTPGSGPKTLPVPGLPDMGPLICYEAIFSGQIVDEAHRPGWLVNITDDAWFGDSAGPRQHFADVRLRAVEEGLPLARAANSGISAMIDAFGRVNGALSLDRQGVLVMALPGALPVTLYARYGLAIPLVLAICAILLGLALSRRRKVK
jgi:apolipoprotein N-acyltransferase